MSFGIVNVESNPKGERVKRLLLAVAVLLFSGHIQAEYVIKFSHVVSPSTPKGVAADWFAAEVNRRMGGRVKVEVFPNSQLYNDKKVMEAMRLSRGKIGLMAAPSLSKFAKFSKQLQAFDIPFIFRGLGDVHKLADSPIADKMTASLEKRGIKALAFWDNGMKVFSIKGEKPIRKVPDDFQGSVFRIQASNVHAATITALGGKPKMLPFKDVYSALRDGVVNGQENAWSNIYSKKFYEVQDYISVSNHSFVGYLVVVSDRFWGGLPNDIRRELASIMREATEINRVEAAKADSADRKKVQTAGFAKVVELSAAERDEWRSAVAGVEAKFEAEIGRELLKEIHTLLGH